MTATTGPLTTALPWVSGLADHGDRVALHTDAGTVTYAELTARVEGLASRLEGGRRLVLLEGGATGETVVAYLAALAAGHVVLLAGAGEPSARQREAYRPDIVLGPSGSVEIVRQESAHELHPDLVLLLSTSGSTGSSKLVRLSAENLAANAWQIDEALGVRADDCAALTLPLTYTYGLSVLNTHLARGAAVVVTERSVVDECFWRLFEKAGASTFPGVPHTFEMLERSGFADRQLPRLRYVTQAGGRMDPERVRRWAALGRERGWDLVVMYGQAEATARMTCLPPHLTVSHPHTVGVPVPGATIDIEDGEIVFRGPNVMLGYATEAADLALGRTVDGLRTGDLGRFTPEGLLEVVGRRARFVKVLGHRVDLDALERLLRAEGDDVRCGGRDDLVVLSVRGATTAPARESLRRRAIRACAVPRDALRVVGVADHPALASGKPDYGAVLALGDAAALRCGGVGTSTAAPSVAGLFAHLLQREVDDDATFVALGGDSLSYVEVSIRLEELLGQLPPSWHVTPVRELERLRTQGRQGARESRRADDGDHREGPAGRPTPPAGHVSLLRPRTWPALSWRTMESSVWLRALATLLIVGTHADLFSLQGTANALLVIAGYQIARFQLADPSRRARVRRVLHATVRIAVPSLVVIVGAHVLGGYYEMRNLFLVNWVFGEPRLGPPWRFWFIEALVLAVALVAALSASRLIHDLDRRHPFSLPLALTVGAFLLFRLPLVPLPVPRMHGSALVVLHLFLLGWALARATTPAQRHLMTLLVVTMIGTFSFNPARDGLTIAFVLLMVWRPVTRVPSILVPLIRVIAAASLYIYVIHWQALELLWGRPVPAFLGSMALGVAYWWIWTRPLTTLWHTATQRSAHLWDGRRRSTRGHEPRPGYGSAAEQPGGTPARRLRHTGRREIAQAWTDPPVHVSGAASRASSSVGRASDF